ncbi:type IV secretion system protein VirB2 [Pseudomonas sp. NPDC098747]|uniref:type IV secretion system protein VirB2 n=1 Tax=Pseudomonas sp. NPDC098747 TaxID=3364487 RepID=UPI00383B1A9D
MFSKKYFARLMVSAFFSAPVVAMASWDSDLVDLGNKVRLGLYAFGGTLALGTLVWTGIRWLIARSSGNQDVTFVDYLQQGGVVMAVGGSMVFGAAAWEMFGSGSPI